MLRRTGWAVVLFALSVGCGDDDESADDRGSGAVCPDNSTLTYEADIQPILAQYCVSCHGSAVSQQLGGGHSLETEDDVIAHATRIDRVAAAGPARVNDAMPPAGAAPSEQQRRTLGEWLACHSDDGHTHDHGHAH